MNELPHLTNIFDRLKRGYHLGPDDEPEFSALRARPEDYAAYFAALGLTLVRHEQDFFYFEPENPEAMPDTLPRIAVFSYIMIDYAANQSRPIEEFIFGQNFLVTALPHFTLDRYAAMLRQVEVHDVGDLRTLLNRMEQIGWVKVKGLGEDEFRFLRPFHRVFSKCLEVAQSAQTAQPDASQPIVT
jgi:chromosome condensin MukBEF MukE localization factor